MEIPNRDLVVVLCDSYYETEQAYYIFVEWIMRHESWTVVRCYNNCNGLTTNDGYAYVFIDARMVDIFLDKTENIVYVQEFFDEIMTDDYNEREVFEAWKEKSRRGRRYALAWE